MISENGYWQMQKARQPKQVEVKYATVIEIDLQGNPIIIFAGETQASQVTPQKLKSYTPVKGELVQIIDGIIQGGVK